MSEAPSQPRRAGLWLAVALLAALGLRVGFASSKGLVLDEFHTLYHASATDADAFFGELAKDNHPPLAMALWAAVSRVAGASELALRLPSIAFSLLGALLAYRLAARIGDRRTGALAAALVGASTLDLEVATQVRGYALVALAIAGMAEALLARLESDQPPGLESGIALAFWTWVAIHTHYYALHFGVLTGVAVLACAVLAPRTRARIPGALAWVGGALALSLPWYLWGFREQLAHQLPPGMSRLGLASLGEALVHLLFLDLRAGGETLRLVFVGAGIGAFFLAVLGASLTLRAGWGERRVATPILLVALGVATPLWAAFIAAVYPRAGFNWQYLAPAVIPYAALVASAAAPGAARRLRTGLVLAVVACAGTLAVFVATGRGTERYREAIEHIVDGAAPGDAVIAVEFQPPLFPLGLAWSWYTGTRDPEELPHRIALDENLSIVAPRELGAHAAVWVLDRSLPDDHHMWRPLEQRYAEHEVEGYGWGLRVHRFGAPR